jgi:hypothetical protein
MYLVHPQPVVEAILRRDLDALARVLFRRFGHAAPLMKDRRP